MATLPNLILLAWLAGVQLLFGQENKAPLPSQEPDLTENGPTDSEYLPVNMGNDDFYVIHGSCSPEQGLIWHYSYSGNHEAKEPSFQIDQVDDKETYRQPKQLKNAADELIPIQSFHLASQWNLKSPEQEGVAAKFEQAASFTIALTPKIDDEAASLLIFNTKNLLGQQPFNSLRLTFSDPGVQQFYGVAVEQSQQYDRFLAGRNLTPVWDANKKTDATFDPRNLYLTTGDKLLVLPYDAAKNSSTTPWALRHFIEQATAQPSTAPGEFAIYQPDSLDCKKGCYALETSPSLLASGINWLWVGTGQGTIDIYALYDSLNPEHITTINTPLVTLSDDIDKRIVGLSFIRGEFPLNRLLVTASSGATYTIDVTRQLFRKNLGDLAKEMTLALSSDATDSENFPLPSNVLQSQSVDRSRLDEFKRWHLTPITIRAETLHFAALEGAAPVDIRKQRGGDTPHLKSLAYRIRQIRPVLQDMLNALMGIEQKSEDLVNHEITAPYRQELRNWLHDSYAPSQWGALGYALWLGPSYLKKGVSPWIRYPVNFARTVAAISLGAWNLGNKNVLADRHFKIMLDQVAAKAIELQGDIAEHQALEILTNYFVGQLTMLTKDELKLATTDGVLPEVTLSSNAEELKAKAEALAQGWLPLIQHIAAHPDDKELTAEAEQAVTQALATEALRTQLIGIISANLQAMDAQEMRLIELVNELKKRGIVVDLADKQFYAQELIEYQRLLDDAEKTLGKLNEKFVAAGLQYQSDHHDQEIAITDDDIALIARDINLYAVGFETIIRTVPFLKIGRRFSKIPGWVAALFKKETVVSTRMKRLGKEFGIMTLDSLSWAMTLPNRAYKARTARVLAVTWTAQAYFSSWRKNCEMRLVLSGQEVEEIRVDIQNQHRRIARLSKIVTGLLAKAGIVPASND